MNYVILNIRRKIVAICFFTLFFIFGFPNIIRAQELINELQGTWRAEVLEVIDEEEREVPGTDTNYLYQKIKVKFLEGVKKDEELIIGNDYLELGEGDKIFVNYLITFDGQEIFTVREIDRRLTLLFFAVLFAVVVVIFGGLQGVRSLIALAGSFFAIFYILMPGLLAGWNPFMASLLVASGVLFAAIFFTHGFNRESTVAYIGTMITVALTAIFSIIAVKMAHLTGYASEEATYLNFNTFGELDFTGLLLGAIIIGVLGVLDDIAITQAAVVSELKSVAPNLSHKELYKKALRVGREHVGALVNTLVLAYTGTALPLLLLFKMSEASFSSIANMEIFATEIIRTIAGSIGLIMTVPIVTLLAVFFVKENPHSHTHTHNH